MSEYFWVPENCLFESGGDCLDKFPDEGPACLVASHTKYDQLKEQNMKFLRDIAALRTYKVSKDMFCDQLEKEFRNEKRYLQMEIDDYRIALEKILEFWKDIDTPKPYFIGDTADEVLKKYSKVIK